jgi:FeS assembly protein IscX
MQKLDWLDVLDIAIELNELYPEIDPQWISFPDLHKKICDLENFCGDPAGTTADGNVREVGGRAPREKAL